MAQERDYCSWLPVIHTAPSKVTTVQYTSARTMLDSSIEGVSRAFDYSEVVFQRYLELTSFTRRTLGVASISQRITECLMQMSSGYYVVPRDESDISIHQSRALRLYNTRLGRKRNSRTKEPTRTDEAAEVR